MLPVQDILPSRRPPRAVLAVVATLGVTALAQSGLDPATVAGWHASLGMTDSSPIAVRALSSLLLATGLVPTMASLGALWIFGDNVEDRLGSWRTLLLLAVAAVGSTGITAPLLAPGAALAGAAGAVGGVVGAHLALFPRMRILVIVPFGRGLDAAEVPSAIIAACWLLLQGFRWQSPPDVSPTLSATLLWPLAGSVVGALLAHGLKRRDRMRVDWWAPVRER